MTGPSPEDKGKDPHFPQPAGAAGFFAYSPRFISRDASPETILPSPFFVSILP
jgi:hypothetical protein